jgi:RecB family exonuclease
MYQVPASHPESVSEERLRKTLALCSSAAFVRISHTGNLSPSLRPHLASSDDALLWSGLIASQSYVAVELEVKEDSQAPPLVQSDEVRGGAGVIKAQSLCPFKAFAEYRLSARVEDDACLGFDALERGECAHRALEFVWREVVTQQRLKALTPFELRELVERNVAQAVQDDSANGPIRSLTSMAERDRLVNVLLQWLNIDRERKHAFVVERLEEKREVEFSGLKLNLRMDRVDRLANGNLVLIDYKSGAQTVNKLLGDRPEEPQLLVYAAALNESPAESIDGLYFGELRNRKARPVGHGVAKHFPKQGGTKDHPADWDEFLETSRDTVLRLADEFKRGDAAVAPLPCACDYCKIKPICRVSTAALEDGGE